MLAQLPDLIKQLEMRRSDSDALSQTLTINEIEIFANEMKMLGDQTGYPPLSQWANQLIVQATTFDMDGIVQTLDGYADLLSEARTLADNNAPSSADSSTDFGALYNALEEQKSIWESVSQTLTINEVEDFATQMQELSQVYNYYPLTEWSEQLALQASTFDMDGMAKTLNSYPILMEQIHVQIES